MENGIAEIIGGLIENVSEMDAADLAHAGLDREFADLNGASVRSYQDAGILTSDAGFVLRLDDGTEYQITVVRSR